MDTTNNQATIDADEDAAFAAGFNDETPEPAEQPAAPSEGQLREAQQDGAQPSGQAEQEAQRTGTETPAPKAEDPFAGLPPAVRDLLAEIPNLRSRTERAESQAREFAGRVGALQSKIDKLGHAPADAIGASPAADRPRLAKVEALRAQGLPEIADAIEELAAMQASQAPQAAAASTATAAPPSDPQSELLDDIRPTWAQDLVSSDFNLWLSTKGKDYSAQIAQTDRAKDILNALTEFDRYRAATKPTPTASPRGSRVAAALTPQGDGRRAPRRVAEEDDEEAAFRAGFTG